MFIQGLWPQTVRAAAACAPQCGSISSAHTPAVPAVGLGLPGCCGHPGDEMGRSLGFCSAALECGQCGRERAVGMSRDKPREESGVGRGSQ